MRSSGGSISILSLEHAPPAGSSFNLLQHPFRLLVRLSLALALLGGFGLGLYLLLSIALGLPLSPGTPALMQVHGHVQAMGFVALFIIAVGTQLFPRFHSASLDRPRLVSIGGLMLGLGVALRALAQPAGASTTRSVALLAGAVLEMAGVLLAVYAFSRIVRRSVQPGPRGRRAVFPAVLGSSLLAALVLNVVVSSRLVADGSIVPLPLNEALLHLELWGFASTMVLTVAGNIFPRFLLLRPTREQFLIPAIALWGVGSLGLPLAWMLFPEQPAARMAVATAQLVGLVLYLHALRLFESPERTSGAPHVTDPTRLWARVAFGFLIVSATLNVLLPLYDVTGGVTTSTMVSGARHAMAQGFLLPVIVFMAARILPGYSGEMVRRPKLLSGLMWTLFVGAALRSVAELVGGYGPGWAALVAIGGSLGVGAFTIFAIGLWRRAT